jgi:putative redox protein
MLQARVDLTLQNPTARQFIAQTGSGHHFILDDAQGATGPKPIELVAVALAGCTAFDVITILRGKRHQHVTGYQVRVEADQAATPPQVFTNLRIHHVVTGEDIEDEAVRSAIDLSEKKYCSVQAMLRASGAQVETTYEIQNVAVPAMA